MFFPCCSLDDGVATLSWFPPAWLVQLHFWPLWPIILVNVEREKTRFYCKFMYEASVTFTLSGGSDTPVFSPHFEEVSWHRWRTGTDGTLFQLCLVSLMSIAGCSVVAWPLVNWLGHLCNLCLWQPVIALGLAFDVLCAHGAGYSFGARQDVYTRSAWKSASSVYIYMLCLDV